MNIFEEVEQAAVAPRLCTAGVMAVLAVLVRQLGYAGPGILLNVFAGREDGAVEVVEGLLRS